MGGEIRRCVECGRSFHLSGEKQRWYREHGLALPVHCDECRSHGRTERDSGGRGLAGPRAQPSRDLGQRWEAALRQVEGRPPSFPASRRGVIARLRRWLRRLFGLR